MELYRSTTCISSIKMIYYIHSAIYAVPTIKFFKMYLSKYYIYIVFLFITDSSSENNYRIL